jgi:hypothetical protein
VHITAPDEDRLEMAAERVRALLVPVDDDKNLHKQQQVRDRPHTDSTEACSYVEYEISLTTKRHVRIN